jgi:hypothetical protein
MAARPFHLFYGLLTLSAQRAFVHENYNREDLATAVSFFFPAERVIEVLSQCIEWGDQKRSAQIMVRSSLLPKQENSLQIQTLSISPSRKETPHRMGISNALTGVIGKEYWMPIF